MVHREVVLPAGPSQVWHAVTDPGALAEWFGGRIDWHVRPGARAVFEVDGATREGLVTEVDPGRVLRFVWWPTGAADDASAVGLELADGPAEGTTVLTVTEERVRPATAPDVGRTGGANGGGPDGGDTATGPTTVAGTTGDHTTGADPTGAGTTGDDTTGTGTTAGDRTGDGTDASGAPAATATARSTAAGAHTWTGADDAALRCWASAALVAC